jgi:putative ABC transport system permease protein
MLTATLRSLLARKLRLLLSAVAVVLGVAFVSGAFVLTDTMGGVVDDLFADINKGSAVAVQGTSALGRGANDREPVPDPLAQRLKRVPGVASVYTQTSGGAQLVDEKGKAYPTGGGPALGVTMQPGSRQEPLRVREGRAPDNAGEVAIDASTARRSHLGVGDRVRVLLKGPARTETVVGIVSLDTVPSFAGVSLTVFDQRTGQQVLGSRGTWTLVTLAAEPGVTHQALRERVQRVLPRGFEALTQEQKAHDDAKEARQGLSVLNTVLLAFAGIALFVSTFLIFNTFGMLVAQRVRELALMRALGASRRQVLVSVLTEAALVGGMSSLVGFALGVGLAMLLRSVLTTLGVDLSGGATVVEPRTFVVSMLVGVVVTVAAALVPARRAARVAPVQAMRQSGPAEDPPLLRRAALGLLVLLAGAGVIASGLAGERDLALIGLGAVAVFLGVVTLSPAVSRAAVGAIGLPARRLGAPSSIGRGNAMRSPRRTAATASALMVGLALVTSLDVLAASVKASLGGYVGRSVSADFLVHTTRFDTFSPEVTAALQIRPEVEDVAAFRLAKAKVNGHVVAVQGVDAAPLERTLSVRAVQGDIASIDHGELAVSDSEARSAGYRIGQTVDVVWSRTGHRPMTIGAIYAQNLFAGNHLVGTDLLTQNTTQSDLTLVAVTLRPGVTAAQGRTALGAALRPYPSLEVQDRRQLLGTQEREVDSLLNLVTLLLLFSFVVAVLGVVNTLALSVVERTRELGLLRAVGMGRRQLRRMIHVESVLISTYGGLLGVVIGLGLGWALVKGLADNGIDTVAVPYGRLAVVLIAAAGVGVLAAAQPARRAARRNVLAAIAEP